jgi:hypothetical protein
VEVNLSGCTIKDVLNEVVKLNTKLDEILRGQPLEIYDPNLKPIDGFRFRTTGQIRNSLEKAAREKAKVI